MGSVVTEPRSLYILIHSSIGVFSPVLSVPNVLQDLVDEWSNRQSLDPISGGGRGAKNGQRPLEPSNSWNCSVNLPDGIARARRMRGGNPPTCYSTGIPQNQCDGSWMMPQMSASAWLYANCPHGRVFILPPCSYSRARPQIWSHCFSSTYSLHACRVQSERHLEKSYICAERQAP